MMQPLPRAIIVAAVMCVVGGVWGLRLQAQQQRDIVRKHDIEDLEHALYRYHTAHGTYPPDSAPAFCGVISSTALTDIRMTVEHELRQTDKYAKPAKPFPLDPLFAETDRDYFYWKTSPASFELLSMLEADHNQSRDTSPCGGTQTYDYSVVSTLRTPF